MHVQMIRNIVQIFCHVIKRVKADQSNFFIAIAAYPFSVCYDSLLWIFRVPRIAARSMMGQMIAHFVNGAYLWKNIIYIGEPVPRQLRISCNTVDIIHHYPSTCARKYCAGNGVSNARIMDECFIQFCLCVGPRNHETSVRSFESGGTFSGNEKLPHRFFESIIAILFGIHIHFPKMKAEPISPSPLLPQSVGVAR